MFTLLRTQKNEILELIKEIGFDPYNFIWGNGVGEYSQGSAPRLIYKGTDYYFQFDNEEGNHCGSYSPSSESFKGYSPPGRWLKQISAVKFWLIHLHRELDEPDLWSELARHQIDGSRFDESNNEPFTAYQVDQISVGINKVRAYIEAFAWANSEQLIEVNKKLDYLINSSKRQGRSDWLHTCIGVLMSISVSMSLAPEQTKTLWELLKGSVSDLIQFLPNTTLL